MKFEKLFGPADKPGGGDNSSKGPLEKLTEVMDSDSLSMLKHFFSQRYELGETAPLLDSSFSEQDFVDVQYRFDCASDHKRGLRSPPMNESYVAYMRNALNSLSEAGYVEQVGGTYRLTQKGKDFVPLRH